MYFVHSSADRDSDAAASGVIVDPWKATNEDRPKESFFSSEGLAEKKKVNLTA